MHHGVVARTPESADHYQEQFSKLQPNSSLNSGFSRSATHGTVIEENPIELPLPTPPPDTHEDGRLPSLHGEYDNSSIGRTATGLVHRKDVARIFRRESSRTQAQDVDMDDGRDEVQTTLDGLSGGAEESRGSLKVEEATDSPAGGFLTKDSTMPRSTRWTFILGLVLITFQTLLGTVFICLMVFSLSRIERRADTSGGSTAVVTEYDTVMKIGLISYLFTQLFDCWFFLSSVTTANQIELLGHLFVILVNVVLSVGLAVEIFSLRRNLQSLFPDLQYYGLDVMMRNATIALAALNIICALCWAFVVWKLYFRLGWRVYAFNGADTKLKRRQAANHAFQVLLKIDILFLFLNTLYLIFVTIVPQRFFVPSTATLLLLFFFGGPCLLYLLGSSASEQRSPATMILFCISSLVEVMAYSLCINSLATGSTGSDPMISEADKKGKLILTIAELISICMLLVTAFVGGYNAYIFTVYPSGGKRHYASKSIPRELIVSTPFSFLCWSSPSSSYLQYANICARALRSSVKDEFRTVMLRRQEQSVKSAKWEGGKMGENVSPPISLDYKQVYAVAPRTEESGIVGGGHFNEPLRVTVVAVDTEPRALALGMITWRHLEKSAGTSYHAVHGSVFDSEMPQRLLRLLVNGSRFDIVVSNPPYVTTEEWSSLEPGVKDWEDRSALIGAPPDVRFSDMPEIDMSHSADLALGVSYYSAVAHLAAAVLDPRRRPDCPRLVVEIGGNRQTQRVSEMIVTELGGDVAVWTDLMGTERCIVGIYSQFDEQDLKKKYGSEWALVSGGSSGIGAAIVRKLAAQGINVVVVALDDPVLSGALTEFRSEFPRVEFREVGCDLSEDVGGSQDPEYIKRIKEKTKDLDVQLIFNNAGVDLALERSKSAKKNKVAGPCEGYIKPGLFPFNTLPSILANYHTNATSATRITHHFTKLLIDKKLRGLVTFTSSSAYWVPTVLSAMYGCTKAYLAQFGAVLAAELRPFGIDVVVLHPGPTNSNFYQNVKDVAVLSGAKAISLPPSYPASALFRAAGRVIVVDQGATNWAFKFACRLVDWNVLVEILAAASRYTPDFSRELKRIGAKGL
ncbi:hypothetical protein HDU93_008075 [Gonapodya sp. JEL0774]|nr:hypothetical protein HDU93_008075 [Gonapodya sp. JEL0774]